MELIDVGFIKITKTHFHFDDFPQGHAIIKLHVTPPKPKNAKQPSTKLFVS